MELLNPGSFAPINTRSYRPSKEEKTHTNKRRAVVVRFSPPSLFEFPSTELPLSLHTRKFSSLLPTVGLLSPFSSLRRWWWLPPPFPSPDPFLSLPPFFFFLFPNVIVYIYIYIFFFLFIIYYCYVIIPYIYVYM